MIASPTTPMVAPIGCSVSVEMNSPIAPKAARQTTMYPQTSNNRHSPTAVDTCAPATSVTAKTVPISSAAYLTASSRVRCTGTASRYRRVPVLASPAIASPAMIATASGRNSGSSTASAASPTNRPLLVAWPTKPPLSPPSPLYFVASPMMIGTAASTPSPAMLRRRPKINRSSEIRNRSDGPLDGATGTGRAISAADTEALPGQVDEDVLQVHRHRPEGPYRDVVMDQRRDDRG